MLLYSITAASFHQKDVSMSYEDIEAIYSRYSSQGIVTRHNIVCLPPVVALKVIDEFVIHNFGTRVVLGWFYTDNPTEIIAVDITVFIDIGPLVQDSATPVTSSARLAWDYIQHKLPDHIDLVSLACFFPPVEQ